MKNGSCTGGPYGEKGVCKPYPFHPCGQHKGQPYYGECEKDIEDTPLCKLACDDGYIKSAYDVAATEQAIQKEIMINGPVQAGYIVYTDFYYYSGGIYK
ncbi:hypothetical protein OESDEN_14102, partial [Oesophagostomum dentatum]